MDIILIRKWCDVREEIPLSGRELDCRPVEEVVFDYRTISLGAMFEGNDQDNVKLFVFCLI